MKQALVVRHLPLGGLGSYAPVLETLGYNITIVEPGVHDIAALDAAAPDLLVMLGGPLSAYQAELFPFLADECRLIERRLAAGKAMFAVCLGAQLVAATMGAPVTPGGRPEIGWGTVRLTEPGKVTALRHLAADTPVLHWHSDWFGIPAGTERLAESDFCPFQAFGQGKRLLALQFHAEVTAQVAEPWLIGHAGQLLALGEPSIGDLRDGFRTHVPILVPRAQAFFAEWLRDAVSDPG